MNCFMRTSVGLLLALASSSLAADAPPTLKTEHFDQDPGWEGFNNTMPPDSVKIAQQDFGYSDTNFAGRDKREIGGRIQRSTVPASYGDAIAPKTLDDHLSA